MERRQFNDFGPKKAVRFSLGSTAPSYRRSGLGLSWDAKPIQRRRLLFSVRSGKFPVIPSDRRQRSVNANCEPGLEMSCPGFCE